MAEHRALRFLPGRGGRSCAAPTVPGWPWGWGATHKGLGTAGILRLAQHARPRWGSLCRNPGAFQRCSEEVCGKAALVNAVRGSRRPCCSQLKVGKRRARRGVRVSGGRRSVWGVSQERTPGVLPDLIISELHCVFLIIPSAGGLSVWQLSPDELCLSKALCWRESLTPNSALGTPVSTDTGGRGGIGAILFLFSLCCCFLLLHSCLVRTSCSLQASEIFKNHPLCSGER